MAQGSICPLFSFLIINSFRKGKNKNMETVCKCPHCAARLEEEKQSEEIGLAFLIALMPLLTVTLFSTLGLF